MWMSVYTADIYDPRSDRPDHIYHKIHVENHYLRIAEKKIHGQKKIVTTPGQQISN